MGFRNRARQHFANREGENTLKRGYFIDVWFTLRIWCLVNSRRLRFSCDFADETFLYIARFRRAKLVVKKEKKKGWNSNCSLKRREVYIGNHKYTSNLKLPLTAILARISFFHTEHTVYSEELSSEPPLSLTCSFLYWRSDAIATLVFPVLLVGVRCYCCSETSIASRLKFVH